LSRIYKEDYKITLGVELPVKTVKRKVKLQFWIFSYDSLKKVVNWEDFVSEKIKGMKVIVSIYNTNNSETLSWVSKTIQLIKNYLDPVPPILLIGNKMDLDENQQISINQVEKVKEECDISSSIEMSLNLGDNIDKTFMKLTEMMLRSAKPDYRIEAKSIEVKKIPPLRIGKTLAFIIFLIIISSSIIGSIIMYYVL
jgi:GTPase Era involved in 16S rRNA processing